MEFNAFFFLIILACILGLIPASMASRKGYSFIEWWLFGAAMFIVALPAAFLIKPNADVDDRNKFVQGLRNKFAQGLLMQCPFCAELINQEVLKCPFCAELINKKCPFCAEMIKREATVCRYCRNPV